MRTANALLKSMALMLAGIVIASPLALAQQRFTLGASPPGGAWYPMAAGLAEIWNKNIDGISVTVEGTGGAAINPRWLADGQVDIALNSLDMVFAARDGTPPYKDDPQDLSHVRSLMLQHSSPHFVVVKAKSDIHQMSDLVGKRVAIGDRGAAANERAIWIFEAHGINPADVRLEYLGDEQAAGALADGRIDAWLEFIAVPAAPVMNLATTNDIRFIPMDDDAVERLRAKWPFMVPTEVPAGTYRGQEQAYTAYGVTGALLVLDSVPEDVVYEMCMTINDHRKQLAEIHRAFALWSFDPDIETITGQPLHPGAKRCYQEIGVL